MITDPLAILGGDTRQRLSSSLAALGDNLMANNPGAVPLTIKVWVE